MYNLPTVITKFGQQKSCFDLTPDAHGQKLKYLYTKYGWHLEKVPTNINDTDDEPYLVDIHRDIKKWSKLINLEREIVDLEKEINSRLIELLKHKPRPKHIFNIFFLFLFFGLIGFSAWLTSWEIYWTSYYSFEMPNWIAIILLVLQWLGSFFAVGVCLAINSDKQDLLLIKRAEKLFDETDDKKLLALQLKLKNKIAEISLQLSLKPIETYLYLRDLYSDQHLLKFW